MERIGGQRAGETQSVWQVIVALITIVSTYLASETFQKDITKEQPAERGDVAGQPG
jgi:hypothetical protein